MNVQEQRVNGQPNDAESAILQIAEKYVRERLEGEASGHDWWHIRRVTDMARALAQREHANVFVCELAALVHDLADEKLCEDPVKAWQDVELWMKEQGVQESELLHIREIVSGMSFKGGGRPPMRTLEGRVVQDADRLDAIGAIGIARVFAYSGAKGRAIHDPMLTPRDSMTEAEYRSGQDTAIMHFHEKLLKLKDLMNTEAARELAEGRHRFMQQYLEQFDEEWNARR